jgi:leader peptidase (prepilin peptidase)/N-methyltransferase
MTTEVVMAMAPVLVVIGVAGLLVGSFLNVVIHRVPRDESLLRPGSRCPRCEAAIRPWHNVPVLSWLVLLGRCDRCGERISARYPLVELATAVLFVAITARFGITLQLPAYLYLAAITIALAMIDFDVKRLPDAIVFPSYLVGALLLIPAAVAHADWWSAGRGLIAMAALFAFYLAIAMVYPGGMGFGDVKLAGLLGLYLGWLGWSSVVVGTFAGFLLGALVGVALVAARRAGRKSALPFGPYMLAGAMLAVFAARPIASWYLSLIRVTA